MLQIILFINKYVEKCCYLLAILFYKNQLISIENKTSNNNCTPFNHPNYIDCLIVAEDKRFLYHPGFDIIAICRAIIFKCYKGIKSGASTIDQQLVRTLTNRREKTFQRKISEIILASAINTKLNKMEIANYYLCYAYYGWHMHGIHQAIIRLKHNKFKEYDIYHFCISLLKYPLPQRISKKRIKKINNRVRYIKYRIEKCISYCYYKNKL